jgi:Na+(H+)/acetate symporter ActP
MILFDFWCFNATFSNISAISWRPVLVVEEVGVPGVVARYYTIFDKRHTLC